MLSLPSVWVAATAQSMPSQNKPHPEAKRKRSDSKDAVEIRD